MKKASDSMMKPVLVLEQPRFAPGMRVLRRIVLSGAVATMAVATSGCGGPEWSLGPPPQLPGVPNSAAPEAPSAEPVAPAVASMKAVEVAIHKSKDLPDLRGQLLAFTPLASEPLGEDMEKALTIGLVERGISRLIPGNAMAEVSGSLDRGEGGAGKGTVKLAAKLSSLSLVTKASGADFILYGEARAGEAKEKETVTTYRIPDEALGAYKASYDTHVGAVDMALRDVRRACSEATARFRGEVARFRQAGGWTGGTDKAGREAGDAVRQYAAFDTECQRVEAALSARRNEAPSPDALVQAASERQDRRTDSTAEISAMLKLREAKTDETFWIADFKARAPEARAAVDLLTARIVQELTAHSTSAESSAAAKPAPTGKPKRK